ncbi:MAG: phosphate ABC transporter permease subunit PstC [Bacilli bacterium]|nr:phosphate ABC transporter permease subunit PstC [Bacilli bacterium]
MNQSSVKQQIDRSAQMAFFSIAVICASMIIVIVGFIFLKGIFPFISMYPIGGEEYKVNIGSFFFSNTWFVAPNNYGVGFIIINTLYIMLLSLIIAVPVSVITALYIVRIAPKVLKSVLSYVIELLASIPSIIYGVFGMGVITALVRRIASSFGYQSAGGISILATVLVLATMVLPTITLVAMNSIHSVRKDIIEGSLALGVSPMETNFKVVLSSSKNGIFSGIIFGAGRALGEATAISMVIGNNGSGPTFNLFDTSRTLTSTILLGIKETSGLDYDIRFSVGIVLVIMVLLINFILNTIKRKIGAFQ